MARVKQIEKREDVAPEHHAVFDEVAARRGRVSGPSTIVLYSPGLARPWNAISDYLQGQSVVEPRHHELAVCTTARECDCAYIWAAHVPRAKAAGVSEAAIDVVRGRREVGSLAPHDALVVRYVRALIQTNRVESDVFGPLLQEHGARWMVDLNAWIGRYSALAGILNSFEVSPAPDADPLPLEPRGPGAVTRSAPRAPLPAQRVASIAARDQVAEADRSIFDAVAEGRGSVRGPFALLMYSPALCKSVIDVSNYLRHDSEVSPRIRELATIATAREKDCPYVWAAHAPAARNEGISDDAVSAIGRREDLGALAPVERDVAEYARQLLRTHRVSQDLFDRLRQEHGIPWLVELTALIGHYGFVTALLNAIEVRPAAGAEALD